MVVSEQHNFHFGYNAGNLSAEKMNFSIEFIAAFALNLQENYTAL